MTVDTVLLHGDAAADPAASAAARLRVAVVLTSTSRIGAGVAESARLLARAVHDQGVEVAVLTLDDRHRRDDAARWAPLPVRAFRTIGPDRYGFSPGLLIALARSNADLVHVHGVWMFHCLAVLVCAVLRGTRYVVTPHGMLSAWIRRRSPALKRIVSRLYQNRFLRRAAFLHVLTEQERVDMGEWADGRVRIVPNYVEPFDRPEDRPSWWHEQFDGRTVYLFLGRIHEKKGCLELCTAWDRICAADPAFGRRSLLVLAGAVENLPAFEPLARDIAERHGNVVLAGPRYGRDKDRCYAAATFFVLPSKSEGLPMTVLEAWSAGVPVLMTRACNLPEGFAAGAALEIGDDAEAIGRGLLAADAGSAAERTRMAAAGRALVAERFSGPVVAGALVDLYREAVRS